MQGVLTVIKTNQKYLFRSDTSDGLVWAWSVYSDSGMHVPVVKWKILPKGTREQPNHVTLFNLDNPSKTVTWQPLLD